MIGILLAGGRGKRLRPLTDHIPKPMVPLLNKPLLDYNLHVFKKSGVERLLMTVCYKKEVIQSYAGTGEHHGLHIDYLEESMPLGTAGSLFNAPALFDETVAVLSGDALTNINLQEAYAFHREQKASVTIVAASVHDPTQFGVCMCAPDGRLLSILEKPSEPVPWTNFVSTGIYFIEPSVFERYSFCGEADFAKDVFPLLLAHQEPVFVYKTTAYWQDIGTISAYQLAEKRLRRGIPGITDPEWHPLAVRSFPPPAATIQTQPESVEAIMPEMLKKQAGISAEKVLL